MKAAVGLLLLLLLCDGDYGVETSCDGRQNNTMCYGPFGGSVVIHLRNVTLTMNEVTWFRNNSKILMRRKGQNLFNKLEGRSVISDETVTLHNLNWDDAGEYKLEINSLTSGKQIGLWFLQLMVEAPVSFVWMSSRCLSQGESKVSCHSVGGHSPFQYSWSLDGVPHDSSENDSTSVTLEPGESGYVVCNVTNNVSVASRGQNISECVFMNCTFSNGTHVSNWVPGGASLECDELTTTMPSTGGKETSTTVSNKPSTNITTSSQTTSNTTETLACNAEGALMVRMLFHLGFVIVVAASFVYTHKQVIKYKNLRGRENRLEMTCVDAVNPDGQQGAAEN